MPNLYSSKQCPSRGKEIGDIHFNSVTKEVFVVLGDLRLWSMSGLLTASPVAVVGPRGEQGERGAVGPQGAAGINGRDSAVAGPQGLQGPMGPKGSTGPAARDGIDGRDSTVPGPKGDKGDSIVGPRGEKGEKGDLLIPTDSEIGAALLELRQQRARTHAAFVQGILDAKAATAFPPGVRKHFELLLLKIQREAGF